MSRKIFSPAPTALDLNKRHFQSQKHGITIIGTWFRLKRNKFEPCLVLLHASRPITRGRTVPIVILLKDAWKWALHGDIGDPAHCVGAVIEWLHEGLLPGSPSDKRSIINVMDAINSRLPDLITMPPRPKGELHTIAEATMINQETGEIMQQSEITLDV